MVSRVCEISKSKGPVLVTRGLNSVEKNHNQILAVKGYIMEITNLQCINAIKDWPSPWYRVNPLILA